ncbi:Mut7-C RNAse domain-containing protein (plasmid) [Skermanella rosea]|uniref:Mut7-C RNAse domain-containing protein n=1 Tax=Skermanella rosea TaxID=1817965 RepID=UPI0019316CCD|nr:Mut7-C RNAse domain-containing protein [Skermanella rosea]UEM07864.1 Mut7-C RNAse domain-containing protein [Skermanella rosea]
MDGEVPDRGMRFLCDEMLHGLGRWLRGAGYDTAIAETGGADGALLDLALSEGRKLLTRDRAILQRRRAAGVVVLVQGDTVHEQALNLGQRLGLDWLADPLSRCMVCNTELEPAPPTLAGLAPANIRASGLPIRHCAGCDRLYWPGSHERRIRATLREFARASAADAP